MKDKSKNKIGKIIIEQITGIFMPVIPMITAASIVKSIIVLMADFGIISHQSGPYHIFYGMSDGFFYFLPFFLAAAAARQWNINMYMALFIPTTMLVPEITGILENGQSLSFLGLTIPPTIYHSSVIPVLLAVGLMGLLEKHCNRFIPEVVRGFMTPILCCLVVLPVTFLLLGPIGAMLGDVVTALFLTIYEWNRVAAGAFMGFVMQPMVVVGAHWSVVPVSIQNIASQGYDLIMPLVGGAVYGQAGASLAYGLLHKKDKMLRSMAYQASLTAVLGVTEPALFGVNVPNGKPFLAGCISGAVGGAIVGIARTQCHSFAFPSFLTSVAYVGPGFLPFLASMGISFVLGIAFTLLLYKLGGKIGKE